jgi:hypothetical protein
MKVIFFCILFFSLISCSTSKVVSESVTKKNSTATLGSPKNNETNSKKSTSKDFKHLKTNDLTPGRTEEISIEINPINKKEQLPSRTE